MDPTNNINNPIKDDLEEFGDINTGEILSQEEFDDYEALDAELDDNFDEVLSLTNVNTDGLTNFHGHSTQVSNYNDAEYSEVKPVEISAKQQKIAEKFIKEISHFIAKLGDVTLTNKHKQYINTVSELKIASLTDLLTLRTMNMEIMANLVSVINSSNGEDIMMIQSYNSLVTTQMKLVKETDQFISSLPNDIRKLRNDVLSPEELEATSKEDLTAKIVGDNTFNNTRSLLMEIEAEEAKQKEVQ